MLTLSSLNDTLPEQNRLFGNMCDTLKQTWRKGTRSRQFIKSVTSTVISIMVPNVPGRGELRSTKYIGFLVFKRQFCGGQFLSDLLDNTIKLEIFDSGRYYTIDSSIMVENGRQTSTIVQVRKLIFHK